MNHLLIGLGLGLLLAVPLTALWSRRTAVRVRRLEKRARTAERLAELGTMTGGLAHEIKNPLSTVGLNIQLLQEDLHFIQDRVPDETLKQDFESMDRRLNALGRETRRLREILEDFLRFAGRMELDCQHASINTLLEEVADFYEPELVQQKITLRRQLTARPDKASVDEGLLKQAVLNLLLNATQAMAQARENAKAHGGAKELILRTENIKTQDGPAISIHVTDTGPGIAQDKQKSIFQPYFSTRAGGSGLGLPTTRRIIDEHGGQIKVHSDEGRGTDFCIQLPL